MIFNSNALNNQDILNSEEYNNMPEHVWLSEFLVEM